MNPQQKIFILVGPSGVGKDTLMNGLRERYPSSFRKVVTHTTRSIRPGEIEGVNYYYVSKEKFETMIKNGDFVEYFYYNNNYYGTSKQGLTSALQYGQIVYLVININGAMNVHKQKIPANFIGVLPLSLDHLKKRLSDRGTESEEVIKGRIKSAIEEMKLINELTFFNYRIINDDLTKAIDEFENKMQILYSELKK